MGIENKSSENIESQNTRGLKSSSLEAQEKEVNTQQEANKLVKIHTFLESIEDNQEDQYKQALLKLDKNSLNLLLKKSQSEILQLLQKPDNKLQLFLIQAQIDELKAKGIVNLTDDEFERYANLKKELIAVENNKQKQQKITIAVEKSETEQKSKSITEKARIESDLQEVKSRLSSIEGSLYSLKNLGNKKIDEIFGIIANTKKLNSGKDISSKNTEKMKFELGRIIKILETPGNLESIAKDLGGVKSEKYINFRDSMIQAEPSLRPIFDRVEMDLVPSIAKMKLGTNNLNGVNIEDDILQKTEDGITTNFSDKEGRFLTGAGGIKSKSELNPMYEEQTKEIHTQAQNELKPFNEKLNFLSVVLDYIKQAKNSGVAFKEVKQQIKSQNTALYNEFGFESINSFDEILGALNTKKIELKKETEKIKKTAKERIDEIVQKSVKEAEEKDRLKKVMFKFFSSIGIDEIGSKKFEQILDFINVTPGKYGLQHKIDLDNAVLGFDKDFGDKEINPAEKVSFIKLYNQMLGENVVDENIAYGTTTLSIEARNRIQVLQNKNTGYFMSNLEINNNLGTTPNT